MAEDLFEQIQSFLPKYLTPNEKRELFAELEKFPDNLNFYLLNPLVDLLQGDGWRGLVTINFETLGKKAISGGILSNSCDIDPKNPRALDTRVLFSPLIRLRGYTDRLKDAGKQGSQVASILLDIRKQRVTNIFCLPSHSGVIEESIILLDDIHGHPLHDFLRQDRSRLFTLNQYAFYILLIKLSIHFSRFQEDVRRFAGDPT